MSILNRYLRQQVSERIADRGESFYRHRRFGMFQTELQLRIFCNHGTFQRLFSWKKQDLNDEREATLTEFGFNVEAICSGCRQPSPILGSSKVYNEFVEDCVHMLCAECLEDIAVEPGEDGQRHCPMCARLGKSGLQTADDETNEDEDADLAKRAEDLENDLANEESHVSAYFNNTGRSTKMEALVKDVKEDIEKTKSIIFSCWTRTLDLVGVHLAREGIKYHRIDGGCILSKRDRILSQFSSRPQIRLLLMTTGVGAFGLNLTAANRVFIVELQWNPSVENQAIARAIRINQTEKVLVTRYVVKNTVEEEMRSQQINKRVIAKMGFGSMEDESEEEIFEEDDDGNWNLQL